MQSSLSNPYVVTIIPETPAEAHSATVAELLIGAVTTAGILLAVAVVLGVIFGVLRLTVRRYFPSSSDHMPPVSPFEPDSTVPPSRPR